MDLKRFFSDNVDYSNKQAYLVGDEFYHATKVTRHKIGHKLVICCGDEYDYYCIVKEITKDKLVADIEERRLNDTELSKRITLYVGVNKDLDSVVQKSVEMGIAKVVPFISAHSNIAKINTARLNKIVLESSKQCGRNKLMIVAPLITIDEAFEQAYGTDIFFYYEHEEQNKTSDVIIKSNELSVFIGSEGGFSLHELQKAKDLGANVLTLGKRILRVATAMVSATALIVEKIGEI